MRLVGKIIIYLLAAVFLSAEIETPKEIDFAWKAKVLGIREVHDLADAIEELTLGISDNYFDTALIKKLREIEKSQPTGEYIEYWPNGKMKIRVSYKDGKAHGHVHGWYEAGADAFKGYYNEGIKQGIHMAFFPVKDEFSRKARLLEYNERGQLHGDQSTCHSSLRLALCVQFRNGLADGPLEHWDVKGNQTICVLYKKGKLQKKLPPPPGERDEVKPKYPRYAGEVENAFVKEVAREFHIHPYMSGGRMPFDVESISLTFIVNKKGTIEEARELEVKLTEKLAAMINNHKGIRPYLREYPFPSTRARVSLSFRDKSGSWYKDGSVSHVCHGRGGRLHYSSADPENQFNLTTLHEEPYETAVAIVRKREK